MTVNKSDYEYCIEVENGKYHIVFTKDYQVKYLRHGEDWIDSPQGSKMMIALMDKVEKIENRLEEAKGLLKDAQDVLGSCHLYNSDTYHDIDKFLNENTEVK